MAAELTFQDLAFEKAEDALLVYLYDIFQCTIPLQELEDLGPMEVQQHSLTFPDGTEKKASRKFLTTLEQHMDSLYCTVTKKPSVYVHRTSGIPLLGYIGFGIIDRGTSLIEVRPMTGCNLNCNYCSVDEGITTRKIRDFVIEEEYLFEEIQKVIPLKQSDNIEIHINTSGEPTLYARFAQLCKDLRTIPQIQRISTNTNGTLLTKELIDTYTQAGLTQINLSLNAIDPRKAKILAGSGHYDVEHCKDMMRYAITKCDVTLSPTLVQGYNEEEMAKIVEFFQELLEIKKQHSSPYKLRMGIQNFLYYKYGRNPAEQLPWEKFYALLKDLEKQYGVQLIVSQEDFQIEKTPTIPKTMKKGQVVKAHIVSPGRNKNEVLATAHERTICVRNCPQESGTIRVKLLRDKGNIYDAVPL